MKIAALEALMADQKSVSYRVRYHGLTDSIQITNAIKYVELTMKKVRHQIQIKIASDVEIFSSLGQHILACMTLTSSKL